MSNRPGKVRYGTTGQAVPGYEPAHRRRRRPATARTGEIGELQIKGPSAAIMYWNNRAKDKSDLCRRMDEEAATSTRVDADGYYTYGGRSDDMLKVGGIYVSPFEVEACLMTHGSGAGSGRHRCERQQTGLMKPKAYVVLKQGQASDAADDLKGPCEVPAGAPYKYPALDRVRPRAAEDGDGEDPAVQGCGCMR